MSGGLGLARVAPLAAFAGRFEAVSTPDVMIRELPFLTQVGLRVDPSDRDAVARIATVVGELPTTPNRVHGNEHGACLWLGPDEWLLVGPPDGEAMLASQLREAQGDVPATAVVELSANRTTLELAGPRAREVLEAGCSIDLHPRAFEPGHCAQTLVARAQVILCELSDVPYYRLFVRPSFAPYLATWLLDAMDGLE